jgi:uncharacterized protein
MRILPISDIHGDRSFARLMAEKADKEKVDLVILAGDIVGHDGSVDGLIGPFKEKGLEVALIPGNHESMVEIDFLVQRYNIRNLHGYVLTKGDVGIFGCGYADVGLNQLNENAFKETLEKTHKMLGDVKKKIMLTHIHPSESILGLGMFEGSSAVRNAIEKFQPDLHICGHIHETHGIEDKIGKTRVINVGKVGKIIDI